MNLAEVVIVSGRELGGTSVESPRLAGLDGREAAIKLAVGYGYADADAFKTDRHLRSVRGYRVLVVAVVSPCHSATLANCRNSRTKVVGSGPGEVECGRVEMGEIVDADGGLCTGSVHRGCEE